MIRTGIFGGSFNPVHQGHIAIGNYFYRSGLLDEVWFVVSPQNPIKDAESLSDATTRLQQVREALKPYPYLKVSDIEMELPRPSYMANTLRELARRYPDRQFTLLIGGDNLEHFSRWCEADWILENYDIFVYPRPGSPMTVPDGWKRVRLFSDAAQMDISSTAIRNGQMKNELTMEQSIPVEQTKEGKKLKRRLARRMLRLLGWTYQDAFSDLRQCVLVIAPHTSVADFFIAELFGVGMRRTGYFLIKKEFFVFPIKYFLNWIGGIPVDRSMHSNHMTENLTSTLKSLNGCIAVTPEGTRKPVKNWRRGFYRIAIAAGVPILMMKIDFKKKFVGIEPDGYFQPTGDEKADIAAIRHYFRNVTAKYPEKFIPE